MQRELLLDTMVQNTPVAMLLLDPADHVVHANLAARRATAPLPGHDDIDWGLIVALRRRASDQVAEAAQAHAERTGVPLGDADRRLMARSVLREIGTAARAQLTALLGTPVHLDLKVKVLKDWQRNAKHLNRLGF